jgi:hypothetical protein
MDINEKELAIIREISNDAVTDQHAIALRAGISRHDNFHHQVAYQ